MNIYIPFSNFEQDETVKKMLYFINNLWNKKPNIDIKLNIFSAGKAGADLRIKYCFFHWKKKEMKNG